MDIGMSTSSDVPLGVAARPRRVGTSSSAETSAKPRYGDFAAAGFCSKPEPPTNFLTYMNYLAEHKHEVPVFSSVSKLVDKDRDKIGSGATFSVYKGSWGKGKAAFKYLKDGSIPEIADRQDVAVPADDWGRTRRKRQYDSAMKSLMFEIKIMAKRPLSRHRNIIRLLGISWDEDEDVEQPTLTDPVRPVLIVELAWEAYPDLESYAKNNPRHVRFLTTEEALSIASDVADGLAALHSFGVVHGDVKPANVLLFMDTESATVVDRENHSPRLVAKIGDFGYSGTVSSDDDVRGGTQFWNAPECLDSCNDEELKAFATHQSRDIYSFGLLLVYLWTNGGSPFHGIGPDLATVDRAKLDDQVSDHCRALIRNFSSFNVAGKSAATVDDLVRETLHRDPRLRCSNIGGVRPRLTSKENTESVKEVEGYTRATFFSPRIAGAPEPMSYENIDTSGFWRGSEKQIPESRKRLLRRGVETDYVYTLTKPERRGLFLAGHAFINAERETNGQAPIYPRSTIHPDYLKNYTAEEKLRLYEELTAANTTFDDNLLVGTDTKEESMIIKGLSYSYQPQGFLGTTVSLRSCIELNQLSIAKILYRLGQVPTKEDLGSSYSLLHLVAMYNRPEFIHLLVKHGLDVNQRGGKMGMTPLHEAVRTGNFDVTLALLDCGADLEAKTQRAASVQAYTPLEFAILGPAMTPKILSLFLERGATYGHTTQSIGTIMASAARPSLLKVLLDHDDRLVQLETRQRKMIHAAVTSNQPESVKLLLGRGADSNARDFRGRTPLAVLTSVNRIGTLINNGIYGKMMGKTRQLRPQMFNPEDTDRIRQILLHYGGEEPDDYMETAGERKMMEAVANYIYWLNHFNIACLRDPVVLKIVQDIVSGTTSVDPTVLSGFAIKLVVDQQGMFTGLFRSMHILAIATEHLPVGSAVLGVSFSAKFKEHLAKWKRSVDWNEFIDFIIGVLRYMQNPKVPESPFPEGLTDADLDSVMGENGNLLPSTGPLSPELRKILEYVWNISIPAEYDAAMDCLLSPFVPDLPLGSPDEAIEVFDEMKKLFTSVREDPSAHGFATLHNQLATFGSASAHPVAGVVERLPDAMSADSNPRITNYKPSFLSDLQPPSPIYICKLNTESPTLRKIGFGVPVFLILLVTFLLLWRMLIWLHWLSMRRFTSLLLLYSLHQIVMMFPIVLSDFSSFAAMALVGGWLAKDRSWQFVLEYSFLKGLLAYNLYNDPHRALIRQISFRWRYGFPEVEPLILSHAQGMEWRYDFAQLLDGLHGSHGLLSTWKGWIERPDEITAVLDEWQREKDEGRESTAKFWSNGWWYYVEGGTENTLNATPESHNLTTETSGTWRKFSFVENSKPDRYLKLFGNIEEMFHSKGRPELYQRWRELFPKIKSGDSYRVMKKAFAEYPDILEATQGIFFE